MRLFKKKEEIQAQQSEHGNYRKDIEYIFTKFLELHEHNIKIIRNTSPSLLGSVFIDDIKRKYGEIDSDFTHLTASDGSKEAAGDARSLFLEYKDFWEKKFEKIPSELVQAEANIKSLDDFLAEKCMFFVVTSRENENNKHYCFSYEIRKESDDTNGVHLQTLCFLKNNFTRLSFSANKYKFRPMTREEFENKFLIEYLLQFKFKNDIEMIEYDNFLRRMFLNQEK